jgi:hypothetical protein
MIKIKITNENLLDHWALGIEIYLGFGICHLEFDGKPCWVPAGPGWEEE